MPKKIEFALHERAARFVINCREEYMVLTAAVARQLVVGRESVVAQPQIDSGVRTGVPTEGKTTSSVCEPKSKAA